MICLTAVGNEKIIPLPNDTANSGSSSYWGFNNLSPSTPTTRTEGTAAKTSPIGRWRNSGHITETTTIGKWDIFHYVYGLLHHPDISGTVSGEPQAGPAASAIHAGLSGRFAKAGQRLGEIHVGYEEVD